MDKEQFVVLVKKHQNLIYKVCNTYCAPENRQDLEQEILLQLWRSMQKFDGRVKITTWMYRVALNTAISFYRKHKGSAAKTTSLSTAIISLPAAEYDLEKEQRLQLLQKFIQQLNAFDRALILLYLDDCSYAEMAEVLGISKTNVATKINRIKKKLRRKFDKHQTT